MGGRAAHGWVAGYAHRKPHTPRTSNTITPPVPPPPLPLPRTHTPSRHPYPKPVLYLEMVNALKMGLVTSPRKNIMMQLCGKKGKGGKCLVDGRNLRGGEAVEVEPRHTAAAAKATTTHRPPQPAQTQQQAERPLSSGALSPHPMAP